MASRHLEVLQVASSWTSRKNCYFVFSTSLLQPSIPRATSGETPISSVVLFSVVSNSTCVGLVLYQIFAKDKAVLTSYKSTGLWLRRDSQSPHSCLCRSCRRFSCSLQYLINWCPFSEQPETRHWIAIGKNQCILRRIWKWNIYIWEAGKTQYVWGALRDMGIVLCSSLYRSAVFGACT